MGRHKEWRAVAKKERRRKIRQALARHRAEEQDKIQSSPRHQKWLQEHEEAEEAQLAEEKLESERRNAKWIQDELIAQQEFQIRQLEKAKQDAEIAKQKEELLKEIAAREEKRRKEEEEREERKRLLQEQERLREQKIEEFLQLEGCELPEELRITLETQPGKPPCPFFQKVAACRFGDACSRNHSKPSISCFILVPGMFSHPSLISPGDNKSGDQEWYLEYGDTEIKEDYKEFFDDACSEIKKLGSVIRFHTCCNHEPHLRGNVYIQMASERDALRACRNLSGRWFGGQRLQPHFVDIPSWKNAICGLFRKGKCPKGRHCNFLHVFLNPSHLHMYSPPLHAPESRRSPTSVRSSRRGHSPVRSSRRGHSPESSSRRSSSRRHHHRSRERKRRRSETPSPERQRHRERQKTPTNLVISARERSLSPWSPGRRLTRDTPPRG